MPEYRLKNAGELFPELVEMNARGVEFPLELRWALNRFQMHQWRGKPKGHDYAIKENQNPYGERGGCVKCVRTTRAIADVLDLMRSQ